MSEKPPKITFSKELKKDESEGPKITYKGLNRSSEEPAQKPVVVLQRDSGDRFIVRERKLDSMGREIVTLDRDNKEKGPLVITLPAADFDEKLTTPGSAWSTVEE